mgnify:CR=1 FL=1
MQNQISSSETPKDEGFSYNTVEGYEDETALNIGYSSNNILVFDKSKVGESTLTQDYRNYYLLYRCKIDEVTAETLKTEYLYYSFFNHLPGDYNNTIHFVSYIDSRGELHGLTYDDNTDTSSLEFLEALKNTVFPIESISTLNGFLEANGLNELIIESYEGDDLLLINQNINPTLNKAQSK